MGGEVCHEIGRKGYTHLCFAPGLCPGEISAVNCMQNGDQDCHRFAERLYMCYAVRAGALLIFFVFFPLKGFVCVWGGNYNYFV